MLSKAIAVVTFIFVAPFTLISAEFKSPEGDVILTINYDGATGTETIELDLAGIEDLGLTTIETSTIWTEGVQSFVGIELATLTRALGIASGTIRAVALNDYAVEIPVSDAVTGGPILAVMRNAAPMSVRDKGPVWVIYPYDASSDYRTEVIYSRSIWQLTKLDFQE
ncbi:hypothetical protein SAMN04488030_1517 [Aliiroseovarius halocynthiae]|uniref:Oxidoreductase n=1 Tax=Aliiroseovarius halocynthiae TaxID=985055 RepID=A0A545SWR0_9RHOB|nr:oxidoreductase [Aliiroseovarius halocynthiae]TQV69384.1 oxidoreductase [Aliiroseovarius halocynthiae]SMR72773.1 hypothetical protein SAMN04488030_1517 [Aliiroseovarius halocynthiae]